MDTSIKRALYLTQFAASLCLLAKSCQGYAKVWQGEEDSSVET